MYSIYKITDLDTGRVYIGSTKYGINQRLAKHKYEIKIGKGCSCRDFNWQNVEVEELEVVEVDHLEREKYHIQNNDCVNEQSPIRTEEELKEYSKEWYENNKEHRKEYKKKYRKVKITCECGSIVTQGNLATHRRTNKHQEFLQK